MVRSKRDFKELLYFMLDRATAEKDWNVFAVVRGKLENMTNEDSMGFIERSRWIIRKTKMQVSIIQMGRKSVLRIWKNY